MASDPYPIYSYSINHNGTITSNRSSGINGNIINKGGLIADNYLANIGFNTSGSIFANTSLSGRTYGSILYNDLEGVIYNNDMGRGGIAFNQSLDIIGNTCYVISNNKTRSIVGNTLSGIYEGISHDISNNITQGDIINNTCSRISYNVTKQSIWSNNITGFIIGNTAEKISENS